MALLFRKLREALAQRAENTRVARAIEEGEDLGKWPPTQRDEELHFDSRWWLERLFNKYGFTFMQGVLLTYILLEIPRLVMLLLIAGRTQEAFVTAFASTFLGDMFIPISLLLLNSVYKSLARLTASVNKTLKEDGFVAPSFRITEQELASQERLTQLDKRYRERYVKPVMLKTLQHGIDLSFNREYQVGSGLVAATACFLFVLLRFGLNVLPGNLFFFADPGVPGLTLPYAVWYFSMICFDWFILGITIWTLFLAFLISIQAGGNAVAVRPFESIKERFAPIAAVIMRTSFAVTFITAWVSPLYLVWSVLPPDPSIRQGATVFVASILATMIPAVILSFLLPILKTHVGMVESRRRVLLLKKQQLEDIKRFRESNPRKYARVQKHLIEDFKDVQSSSEWVLNVHQMIELSGTVLLPIVTFVVSIGFW